MCRKPLELQEGAILVADAHYSDRRPELLEFLRALDSGEIECTQLWLMGDIFDLLFGPIAITKKRNAEAIASINSIALKVEVIYLEGNHDFQLRGVFENVTIFPLSSQPVQALCNNEILFLAHGDLATDWQYRLYTSVIRSRPLLWLLEKIDSVTSNSIIRWLDGYLGKKEDCNEFDDFETFVERRFSQIDTQNCRWFVEGHYHQNRAFEIGAVSYINLGAFACNQRYFVVQSPKEQKLLKEVLFGKEP